jgi:hypothetical protein
VTIGGGASIPLVTQRLSEYSRAPVVTAPQPSAAAALGAAMFATYGSDADAQTGVAPAVAVATEEPGSATFRALAWSQDDGSDEPLPYTGADAYDNESTTARPAVQYVPATGAIEKAPAWQRVPHLAFAVAAIVALVAVGGVAYALTSIADSAGPTTQTRSPEPPSAQVPAPTVAQSPPVLTVTQELPPPPPSPPVEAAPPPPATVEPQPVTTTVPPSTTTTTVPTTTTTTATTTTTTPTTTTTTTTTTTATTTTTTTTVPTTTSTTTTTVPAVTTTYLSIPFLPVPIPIQVPNRNQGPPP